MDTTDQLSSIKPGDRNSISLALGLFLLLIFFLVVVSEKFLSPMQNFVGVDKNYIYGYYAFASIISFFGILFLSKLHKIGFRWFTKYTKVTRPDSSWLFIIEIITLVISLVPLIILSQIYNEAFLHTLQNGIANPSKENLSNFLGFLNTPLLIAISLIIIIFIYYIFLSVISRLILPISIGDAFKSSILNLLICILIYAPMIAYSGWVGMKVQNTLNEKKVSIENKVENSEPNNPSKPLVNENNITKNEVNPLDIIVGNLCPTKNDVLFSCSIDKSEKSVSICKAGDSVNYLFGTSEKIDVTLPEGNNKSLIGLNYQLSATGEKKGVTFTRGDYIYLVQNVFGGKPPSEWDEIVIFLKGKELTTLTCSNSQMSVGNIQNIFNSLKSKGVKVVEK